jgi:WD40 repeat protein
MKHTGPISSVAAKGTLIATGGYDNRVILWDAITHQAVAQGMHDHLVNHCAFSADNQWLVSSGSDYSARIWELPGLRLRAVLTDHTDDVDMAVFAPDSQAVATCALDRAVRLFDLSGRCLKTFLGHTGNIISLLWSLDGSRLVSSSVDGTVREWDVETGLQLSCYDLDGVRTDTIAMDTYGRIIAGDDRGRIAIIHEGRIQYHAAHQAGIKKLVYCQNRQMLATLSYDRTLALWQINRAGLLVECRRSEMPEIIWPRAADLLGDEQLVLGTFGSSYAVYNWVHDTWDTAGIVAGKCINAITVHQGSVYSVGDSGIVWRDGVVHVCFGSLCNFILAVEDRLFSGGQLGQLYEVESGKVLYQHHSPLNCGALFYRSGSVHLAIGTYTGEILIFVMQADKSLRLEREVKVFENAIKGLAANHTQLFSVCASSDIAWHGIADLKLIHKINQAHDKIVNACCRIGEQGFASVSRDRTLRLWLAGEQAVYPSPHPNSIKSIALSADGLCLLTGSYTGTLALFDLSSRQWSKLLKPTIAGISAICFDALQGQFLAASYDGQVYPVSRHFATPL